jgi:hypothetical protein
VKTIHEKDTSFQEFSTWENQNVEWKSPLQLNQNAVFIDNDFVFDDVNQGNLGNCWFLAALQSILEQSPDKLNDCVPKCTNFRAGNYNGTLEFIFYDKGLPTKVVITDRLPTRNGRLIFANSNRSNEYWTALIEKAYAVFHGGYDKIVGGWASNGLQDLANMVTKFYWLHKLSDDQLRHYVKSGIACCASSNSGSGRNNGIVSGHAYAVKDVCRLPNDVDLIELINPWGSTEFDGDWSNKSLKWKAYPHLKPADINDGVFHMSFADFRKHFKGIYFAFN